MRKESLKGLTPEDNLSIGPTRAYGCPPPPSIQDPLVGARVEERPPCLFKETIPLKRYSSLKHSSPIHRDPQQLLELGSELRSTILAHCGWPGGGPPTGEET